MPALGDEEVWLMPSQGLTDQSGNDYIATFEGDASVVDGKYEFDGTGDYISVAGLDNRRSNLSLSVWVQMDSYTGGAIFGRYKVSTIFSALNVAFTTAGYFLQSDAADGWNTLITNGGRPALDTWAHICVVNDGDDATLYLNGVATGTVDTSPASSTAAGLEDLRIGSVYNSGHKFLDGRMEDFRLFYRGLTPTEVATLHSNGPDTDPPVPPSGYGTVQAVGTIEGQGLTNKSGYGFVESIASLDGEGQTSRAGSGTIVADGSISGVSNVIRSGSGSITAVADLEGEGKVTRSGSGTILSTAIIDGVGSVNRYGSGGIESIGLIEGVGYAPSVDGASGYGVIRGGGVLAGVGQTDRSGSGSIQGEALFLGVGSAPSPDEKSGYGSIQAIASITGEGRVTKSGSGSITSIGSTAGQGEKQSSGSGSIEGESLFLGVGIADESTTLIKQFYFYVYS